MIKSSRQLKDLIRNLSKEKSADVENDDTMNKLWKSYQKKFSYAEDITWGEGSFQAWLYCPRSHPI